MKTQIWHTAVAAILLMLAAQASRGDETNDLEPQVTTPNTAATNSDTTNASITSAGSESADTNAQPVKVIRAPKINLPPALAEVVRLSESGADETVIRAYIDKSAPPYRLTGDQIIQLQDLGISQEVILALIEHGKNAPANGDATVASVTPPPSAQTNDTASTPPTPPESVTYFYDSLAPYGSWLDVPGYGWCWQPTVVVVNRAWRPYCDRGDWLWSDCGWYWRSYYSWGWAPFHYGRWFSHPRRGWVWCPDRVWGPSWVSWRSTPAYCGWAPLPPGAFFSARIGWTFHGGRVRTDFGFGLRSAHFTFVANNRFFDRHVGVHSLRGREVNRVFDNTTVVNNYVVGSNNRIINRGLGRERIESATRRPIREVAVRDLSPDQPSRAGNGQLAFRPAPTISMPRSTVAPNFQTRPARNAPAAASRPLAPSVDQRRAPRAIGAGGSGPVPVAPNNSGGYRSPGPAARPFRNLNPRPVPQSAPATRSQPQFSRPMPLAAAPLRPAIPTPGVSQRGGSPPRSGGTSFGGRSPQSNRSRPARSNGSREGTTFGNGSGRSR